VSLVLSENRVRRLRCLNQRLVPGRREETDVAECSGGPAGFRCGFS